MFIFELNLEEKEEAFLVKIWNILGKEKTKEKALFCVRNGAFKGTGLGEGEKELSLKAVTCRQHLKGVCVHT